MSNFWGPLLIEKLRAERNIGDFSLPETDEMTPTKYVLDGQQRLTVMYSSFGAEPDAEGFAPFYDLEAENFIVSPSQREVHHFPLRLTYRTTELLNYRTALQTLEKHHTYQERLDQLIGAITGYRLPVVELRDLTVSEVCPIFERINSSGTKLSTFDLIAAATWTQEFDLSDQALEIAAAIAPKGFDGLSNETVLKCISAASIGSVKKEDVLTLRTKPKSEIVGATESVKAAMLLAVDFLATEFNVTSMAFVPYEAHLIALVNIFSDIQSPTSDQLTRLRQWFWRSSLSQHYRGASEAFVTKSLSDVLQWVKGGAGNAHQFGNTLTPEQIANESFHFRGATSKALVLALARNVPRNLISGSAVDVGEALSGYNKRQFHHIYPQAYLKRTGETGNINSFSNICMLSAQENNRISDIDPNVYLPRAIEELGGDHRAVFSSAFMPAADTFDYANEGYAAFTGARAEILGQHFEKLCSGET